MRAATMPLEHVMARILLIDGDLAGAERLARCLTAAGHDVAVERDGWSGLERVLAEAFDVVLTEMLLARRDGAELIGELRELQPSVRILARTGGDDEFDVDDLLDLARFHGAEGTLRKSLDDAGVAAYLAHWLAQNREDGGAPR